MPSKVEDEARVSLSKPKRIAVESAVKAVEKRFGAGALMRLGDEAPATAVPAISTGSAALDRAIGCGGYPRGRIVEVFGPESSGKTTLTLHAIAEVQKSGGVAAFIDAEHALDPTYARALGVRLDELLVSQPDNGEQALEIADTLVASGGVDLIVIDSVAALVPRAELEGDMGDSLPGLHARLMSQALRKLTAMAHRHNVTIIFINQIRMKIGVLYGNPETTTGGNALKFYASLRLDVRRRAAIKDGDQAIGNTTEVKIVKNKLAPPFRSVEFEIYYGKGIDRYGDLLDLALALKVVEKTGSWYAFDGAQLGQGRAGARAALEATPGLFTRILAGVFAHDAAGA